MIPRAKRWAPIGVAASGVVIGLHGEWLSTGFDDLFEWVPDLLVGWVLIGCGVVVWWRRSDSRVGWLLSASGLAWFLGNYAYADVAWIAWIGRHSIYVHRGPLMHAILAFPAGRARARLEQVSIAAVYIAAVFSQVWHDEWLTVVLACSFIVVAAIRYATAVARERQSRRTALWIACVLGGVLAAGAAARLASSGETADDLAFRAYEIALCICAAGLSVGVLASWGGFVTDLVVELGGSRSGALRDSLSRALGDPQLEIGYWSPEVETFVDAAGDPLVVPRNDPERAATVIDGATGPVAVLVHHRSLLDDPGLVDSVRGATQLASRNARLQAELRARIVELEASRRRIVSAGDEEQRRLEERLRTGAVRRVETLAARLASVDNGRLVEIEEQLVVTLDDLRTLGAGLHPALLTEGGLGTALPVLAARCTTPVEFDVGDERLPAPIEAAVYFVCSEALVNIAKHAGATHAAVAVNADDVHVKLTVTDDGVGGAHPDAGTGLRNLIDRVEALGGSLTVVDDAGTRLVAELPLGDQIT